MRLFYLNGAHGECLEVVVNAMDMTNEPDGWIWNVDRVRMPAELLGAVDEGASLARFGVKHRVRGDELMLLDWLEANLETHGDRFHPATFARLKAMDLAACRAEVIARLPRRLQHLA